MQSEIKARRGSPDGRRASQLAQGLGWFSLGFGILGLAAPRVIARAIGIECDRNSRRTMRIFGAREIAAGAGILASPTSPAPVWTRVICDAIDLAFLGYAWRTRLVDERRLAGAIAMVAGVTGLDAYTAARLHKVSPVRRRRPERRRLTVTVNLPLTDVQRRWREVAGELAKRGNVTFRQAPGGRGTEICLAYKAPPLIKQVFNRVVHTDVEQLADGDLRKVKQLLELGEIVHSDASVRRGMHAAQPPERDLHLPEAEGSISESEPQESRIESTTTTFTTEVRP